MGRFFFVCFFVGFNGTDEFRWSLHSFFFFSFNSREYVASSYSDQFILFVFSAAHLITFIFGGGGFLLSAFCLVQWIFVFLPGSQVVFRSVSATLTFHMCFYLFC